MLRSRPLSYLVAVLTIWPLFGSAFFFVVTSYLPIARERAGRAASAR